MRFYPASALKPGMVLGQDIMSSNRKYMLRKGITLTEEYIIHLQTKGYLGAYIADRDTEDIVIEEPVTKKTFGEALTAVNMADIPTLIKLAPQIVEDIANLHRLSVDLLDVRSFDDYTEQHSVCVAIMAVMTGKYMGMSENEQIQICQAGLFHDLGKAKIDPMILNKPGKLSDEEFQEIKNHPKYSFDIISDTPEIAAIVRQAVICHHENENGTGYPLGREGSKLPLMTKILHAVDVYDALTSIRPYKEAYTPHDAFEYLKGGKNILFNAAVVEAMRMVIPVYPLATEVGLSNGVHAIVVEQTEDPSRPVVRTLDTKEVINLTYLEYRSLFIVSSGYVFTENTNAVDSLNEKRASVKTRTPRILIVDDSAMSLHNTKSALEKENYILIGMQNSLAAINYIKENGTPDLIIMDIEMPMLNGIDTVSKIRAMGYKDVKVMFLTGKGDRETVIRCKSVNAKDYIIKPVRPMYLKERVALALDARQER